MHVPSADVRAWRGLIELRRKLVGRRTAVKSQLRALLRGAGVLAERFGGWVGGTGVFSREKADEMLAEAWVCDLAGQERLLPRATPLAEGTAETAQWYRAQGWI